ncbi:MAG TPA: hypothetical protein PLD25_32580 [Chloroflexota bacterium]|nr:hypothetical protein [Chloroflexota bacterium]HUM70495.1 hypothetical protein [Chloroflexota bacterium]
MNKTDHPHQYGEGAERAAGRCKQSFFDASLLFLITFYALVSLVIITGGQRDLTGALVTEVGVMVILWLLLTIGLGIVLRHLLNHWFGALAEPPAVPEPPAPDRLTQYLALKQRLHGQYEAENWWDPRAQAFCYDFRIVELDLPRSVHEKVMAWAQDRDLSFSQAADALLTRGLADDHLNRITIGSGWAEWPKAEGGPPWM